ncbi:hypothetical protein GE061_002486 [Apolygus lucorum]|uniref:Uncharacterized protein n=1 Tax=Apolygus lucorum TaxID=248454 RepID=A0A8S9X7U9_APOLU|nr:hypothetical protein GE061_002486 [Apolygus lucorum]
MSGFLPWSLGMRYNLSLSSSQPLDDKAPAICWRLHHDVGCGPHEFVDTAALHDTGVHFHSDRHGKGYLSSHDYPLNTVHCHTDGVEVPVVAGPNALRSPIHPLG